MIIMCVCLRASVAGPVLYIAVRIYINLRRGDGPRRRLYDDRAKTDLRQGLRARLVRWCAHTHTHRCYLNFIQMNDVPPRPLPPPPPPSSSFTCVGGGSDGKERRNRCKCIKYIYLLYGVRARVCA